MTRPPPRRRRSTTHLPICRGRTEHGRIKIKSESRLSAPSISGRDGRSMTRTGAPFGAPPRRFLCPRDRLLETEGGLRRSPDPERLSPCVHPLLKFAIGVAQACMLTQVLDP